MKLSFIYSSLFALAALLLIGSCCKKRVYCASGPLKVAFVGFNRSEITTVILRRYKTGEHQKPLDTAQFQYNGSEPVKLGKKDTLWFSDYYTIGNLSAIQAGNDWDIYIRGTKQTFAFSTIFGEDHQYEMAGCSNSGASCVNNIAHFSINGLWQDGNTIYIWK